VLVPLILLLAGGVIAGEVEVAKGGTRSGHHLLELLLFSSCPRSGTSSCLALVARIVLVVVVLLLGGVKLLLLGAVGDEVGGVAALEAAPR
jgi:hypothetical protein